MVPYRWCRFRAKFKAIFYNSNHPLVLSAAHIYVDHMYIKSDNSKAFLFVLCIQSSAHGVIQTKLFCIWGHPNKAVQFGSYSVQPLSSALLCCSCLASSNLFSSAFCFASSILTSTAFTAILMRARRTLRPRAPAAATAPKASWRTRTRMT